MTSAVVSMHLFGFNDAAPNRAEEQDPTGTKLPKEETASMMPPPIGRKNARHHSDQRPHVCRFNDAAPNRAEEHLRNRGMHGCRCKLQ